MRGRKLGALVCVALLAACGSRRGADPRAFDGGPQSPLVEGEAGAAAPDGGATSGEGGASSDGGLLATPHEPVDARVATPATPGSSLPAAPPMLQPVRYVARPGSVVLQLPKVDGAADYRVFALDPGVTITTTASGEHVEGAVISCAGLVQHNQCDQAEALSAYGDNFRVPSCSEDPQTTAVGKSVAQQVQVDGLRGKTMLVVEAIDALCPFPGAYGAEHAEVECYADAQTTREATFQGRRVSWPVCPPRVPIRTEEEIRADYGSLILNGQGPLPAPAGGSPWVTVGLPAPKRDPKVIARAVVEVEPLAPETLPPGFLPNDFYESFSDATDVPKKVAASDLVPSDYSVQNATLWQTSKLSLYSYSAESPQFFLAHGTMRSVMPDWAQNIMASNVMVPRRAFALPSTDDRYVHVTFQAPTDATLRRYFWFWACGAAQPGQTVVSGRLAPRAGVVPQPGFMNPVEGYPISLAGWNCIQLVPRNGSYNTLAGSPYPGKPSARPESDIRVVLNLPSARPYGGSPPDGVVLNVSPSMDGEDPALSGSWHRQWDASKKIVGPMLDDQLYVEQRVTFDVYFNRKRLVLYANGVQKLCNDYTRNRLSMAEAAIGVGHVLYHSSAEREDLMRDDWIATAQNHYLHNLSMLDQRSFDNFGVREGASLPGGFSEGACYDPPR